jgi:hypothetical protein
VFILALAGRQWPQKGMNNATKNSQGQISPVLIAVFHGELGHCTIGGRRDTTWDATGNEWPEYENAGFASDSAPPPFATIQVAENFDCGLLPRDLRLLTTGATGLKPGSIDTRIANVNSLPSGPFQLTPGVPYAAYAASPFIATTGRASKVDPRRDTQARASDVRVSGEQLERFSGLTGGQDEISMFGISG